MAVFKSWLVAAITRTSTWIDALSPTRRISCSWITRRSLAWKAGVVSAISSKKNVPPPASSKSPCRSLTAPVKAPLTCPNSSLSRSVSLIAAQFTGTNGRVARFEFAWIARAINSFPVPLSPVISTVTSVGATRTSRVKSSRIGADRPTSASSLYRWRNSSEKSPTSTSSRRFSSARCTRTSSSLSLNGFDR